MPTKTLGEVATGRTAVSRTYSVPSCVIPDIHPGQERCPVEIDSFLEEENPLGCIRGVMWVMVFNAAAILLGMAIWQACKRIF